MAAILDDIPHLTHAVATANPSEVEYGPRQDLPRRVHETVATVAGCALAMGLLFLLLR